MLLRSGVGRLRLIDFGERSLGSFAPCTPWLAHLPTCATWTSNCGLRSRLPSCVPHLCSCTCADQVTVSSLNRHAVATRSDVGTPKAACLGKHFKRIMPEVGPLCACRQGRQKVMKAFDSKRSLALDHCFDHCSHHTPPCVTGCVNISYGFVWWIEGVRVD